MNYEFVGLLKRMPITVKHYREGVGLGLWAVKKNTNET